METWAQSTSWDVSEAIPEHSVSGHRQMRRSLGRSGGGGLGGGQKKGGSPRCQASNPSGAGTHTLLVL